MLEIVMQEFLTPSSHFTEMVVYALGDEDVNDDTGR
jgi:hypothetical protein